MDNENFIVSSLKDKSIYTFLLNDKKNIENFNRIEIGERIRDMVYLKKTKNVLLFLEDTASIGIFSLE